MVGRGRGRGNALRYFLLTINATLRRFASAFCYCCSRIFVSVARVCVSVGVCLCVCVCVIYGEPAQRSISLSLSRSQQHYYYVCCPRYFCLLFTYSSGSRPSAELHCISVHVCACPCTPISCISHRSKCQTSKTCVGYKTLMNGQATRKHF